MVYAYVKVQERLTSIYIVTFIQHKSQCIYKNRYSADYGTVTYVLVSQVARHLLQQQYSTAIGYRFL